ncbi:hypothetical protein, partial [Candidatus Electronema sp. TJ]|uniref:hypothetical protein n=1 Tax=Candidatus Electronema sp. TJ TaxID=3401573 RepID=UPI003AA89166
DFLYHHPILTHHLPFDHHPKKKDTNCSAVSALNCAIFRGASPGLFGVKEKKALSIFPRLQQRISTRNKMNTLG